MNIHSSFKKIWPVVFKGEFPPDGGVRGKVRRSWKSSGIIHWGLWISTSTIFCSNLARRCWEISNLDSCRSKIETTGRFENTIGASNCPFTRLYNTRALTSPCCHVNGLSGVHWEIIWILTKRRTGSSLWEISVIRVGDDEAVCIAASRLCLCSPAGERAQWRDDWYCFLLIETSRMEPDGHWHCTGNQNNTSGEIYLHMMTVSCALS